jgi:hypothetical protein
MRVMLDSSSTAVVLIEFQNDATAEGVGRHRGMAPEAADPRHVAEGPTLEPAR